MGATRRMYNMESGFFHFSRQSQKHLRDQSQLKRLLHSTGVTFPYKNWCGGGRNNLQWTDRSNGTVNYNPTSGFSSSSSRGSGNLYVLDTRCSLTQTIKTKFEEHGYIVK